MQGIYTYIPLKNYVPREYTAATILLLVFMVLISLVSVLNLLYFYISTFRIIIIIIFFFSFMQNSYTYIAETNCDSREYSVAAILLLLFMVLISLVSVLNLLYFYIITFRSMCAVPNMAVFYSSLTSCFPGMLLTYFPNDFEIVPVAPIIIIIIIIIIISAVTPVSHTRVMLQKLTIAQIVKQMTDINWSESPITHSCKIYI